MLRGVAGVEGVQLPYGRICIREHMWFTGLISTCSPWTFVAEIVFDTLLLQQDLVACHRWFTERSGGV